MRTLEKCEIDMVSGGSDREGVYHDGAPHSPGEVTVSEEMTCAVAAGMATFQNGPAAGKTVFEDCMAEAEEG